MGAGDTLYIRRGTYEEPIYPDNGPIPTGTSWSNAPTISAYGDETVIVRGIGFYGLNFAYIIFKGLTVDMNGSSQDGIWISQGSGYIRFIDIEVRNGHGQGVQLTKEGAGHNEFIRCNVHHNGDVATYHNHDLYVRSDSNLFDNCDIHDNIAWGMHIFSETESGTADNNIVRNSRIYNNGLLSSNDGTAGMIIGSGSGQHGL